MKSPLLLLIFIQLPMLSVVGQSPSDYPPCHDIPITKPGCPDGCGKVQIPYPFGIGANCYYNKTYEITCNTSFKPHSKPFLPSLKNLEVLEIQASTFPDYGENTITVKTPHFNVCRANGDKDRSIDLRGLPFVLADGNELIVEGCPGDVVVLNETNHKLTSCMAECDSPYQDCPGKGCCREHVPGFGDFYQVTLDGFNNSTNQGCNLRVSLGNNSHSDGVSTTLNWEPVYLDGVDDTIECSTGYIRDNFSYRRRMHEILGSIISTGTFLLLIFSYGLYKVIRRIIERKKKANNFKRNGGLLLQQQMNTSDGLVEKTKIFTVVELEKATDNFNKNRILGQGGQGTVYKGMMVDGGIVAVKKSKKVDDDEGGLQQFINEVVILSQINHRNVVRLLGCCLETEVPLLVYEFIPNGTLYEHIQDSSEDGFHVTWSMRLQIAAESAGALAYLHSSSSMPIYHRDVKSTNILLDDKYRAKVSDFGTSRAISIEQTHVTTCVQGTYGYLDPEYFQSHQFTEKSDVYSFGVVLVELITGKKPIHPTKMGGWMSLASEFLSRMEMVSCDSMVDMFDSKVYEEGKKEEFMTVANLARQCLRMNAKKRPTMKEVARVLDDIMSPHVANPGTLPIHEDDGHVIPSLPEDGNVSCFSIEAAPLILNTL